MAPRLQRCQERHDHCRRAPWATDDDLPYSVAMDGPVISKPEGINCGSTCSGNFGSGTAVVLTATPNSTSTFSSAHVRSRGPCTSSYVFPVADICDALHGSVSSTLTITAPAAGAQSRLAPLQFGKSIYAMWFPLIFGITVTARSKKHRPSRWILCGVLLLLFILQIACGGGSSSSGPPPPTNYTVTVTGTSVAIQHTTQVAITVSVAKANTQFSPVQSRQGYAFLAGQKLPADENATQS